MSRINNYYNYGVNTLPITMTSFVRNVSNKVELYDKNTGDYIDEIILEGVSTPTITSVYVRVMRNSTSGRLVSKRNNYTNINEMSGASVLEHYRIFTYGPNNDSTYVAYPTSFVPRNNNSDIFLFGTYNDSFHNIIQYNIISDTFSAFGGTNILFPKKYNNNVNRISSNKNSSSFLRYRTANRNNETAITEPGNIVSTDYKTNYANVFVPDGVIMGVGFSSTTTKPYIVKYTRATGSPVTWSRNSYHTFGEMGHVYPISMVYDAANDNIVILTARNDIGATNSYVLTVLNNTNGSLVRERVLSTNTPSLNVSQPMRTRLWGEVSIIDGDGIYISTRNDIFKISIGANYTILWQQNNLEGANFASHDLYGTSFTGNGF